MVVGRDPELETLRNGLQAASHGDGTCVWLAGEAGIGKSRLAREVSIWAAENHVRTVSGRAVPASASTAYRPLIGALLQLLRSEPLPDGGALTSWLPALDPLIPGVVTGGGQAVDVSPAVRGEAVLQLLRRVVPDGLVMVLEDLHWADPDTVSVIEYLADNLHAEPLLLVLTLRDQPPSPAFELARRTRHNSGVRYVLLQRLTDDEMSRMAQACDPSAGAEVVGRVQQTADGVPLLVEELLASPGLPDSFASTVKERLVELSETARAVIEAASVLGHRFDWTLLAAMTGLDEGSVAHELGVGVEASLMTAHGPDMQFRHALTREAVLETLRPPRQRQLATAGLAALLEVDPTPEAGRIEVAIDLALRSGQRQQAGLWLIESGRSSLAVGALATAVDTLRRAADLLGGTEAQADAELELVTALALAGRVDEAAASGGRLISRLTRDPDTAWLRAETHLRLAHAAISASRWQMAHHHLDEASGLIGKYAEPATKARLTVLRADVAIAEDAYDRAQAGAEAALDMHGATADVRCHALEIIGRCHRSRDLTTARAFFEQALITAETADLPLWRLRALHELGTIDLFDHAGVDRLLQARQAAESMGALSTAAILDLQLTAGFTCRWDLERCDLHARSAIDAATHLGLDQVRAKGLAILAESASMRADLAETERYTALTLAAEPGNRMLEGFCLSSHGVALLLAGRGDEADEPYARGIAVLDGLPHAEPAAFRALWPLFLAARRDRRAQAAIDSAKRLGLAAFHLNRGLIGYAEALLAGAKGDRTRARNIAAAADAGFANCLGWLDLARVLAAEAAMTDGWGDPHEWLFSAAGPDGCTRSPGAPGPLRGAAAIRPAQSVVGRRSQHPRSRRPSARRRRNGQQADRGGAPVVGTHRREACRITPTQDGCSVTDRIGGTHGSCRPLGEAWYPTAYYVVARTDYVVSPMSPPGRGFKLSFIGVQPNPEEDT